jgi:non-ribosomal peptide synthetase component F
MGSTVGKISILPCDEKQLLQFFNNTSVLYPKEKCLHELFEKTVAENANTTAVVFENHSYTYAELNQMANSIAYELRRLGVTRNDIVPIIARRSHLVLAAQFGVIKAGGAYLPIDPDYPQDRIDYMLDDAKCKVALIYQANMPSGIDSVIDLANLSIGENLPNPQALTIRMTSAM